MKKLALAILSVFFLSLSVNATTIGYWRFEEGENGVKHIGNQDDWYKDSSGFTNDMSSWSDSSRPTPTNSLPFATVPQTGTTNTLAMDFIPANDLGTFGTGAPYMINSYPFTSGFTVECMVKVRQINWQVAVGKDGEPGLSTIGWWDPSFHIKFRADASEHKIHLGFWSTPSNWVSCMSSFDYNIGEWYYIAAVCDGTQAYLYIKQESDADYELESTAPVPGGSGMLTTDNTWTIGRGMWHNAPNDFVDGIIDEVRISDVALATNQFLAFGKEIVVTGAPEFVSVDWTDAPTPVETRDVTVYANIKARNTVITNAALYYRVNAGSYIGPIQMTTNTASSFVYYGNIASQVIDSVVDFYMTAVNAEAMTTDSSVYQYKIYEDLKWKTVVVATNASSGFPNMTSMALAPNGNIGLVYRLASTSNATYVGESSLGILEPPVAISSDNQGYISDLAFGTDGEPRATLSAEYHEGGVTFAQRTNGAWVTPMLVVSNDFEEYRSVITIGPDQKTGVLWYENETDANGKLVEINAAGDSFTTADVTVPPFPVSPNGLRRTFGLLVDTDGKRRIAISGPGSGDDQIWFGTEDSAGSGTFNWEQLAASNVFADQIGFALDADNNAYIACEDLSDGAANSKCVLLENTSGSWESHILGDIADIWNRSAIAFDPDGNVWVAHNSHNFSHFYLWSNRSGNWKEEQTITNGFTIETISGFGFTDDGIMKVAYTPAVDSPELVYMYSTKFLIPEPGILTGGIILALLLIKRK